VGNLRLRVLVEDLFPGRTDHVSHFFVVPTFCLECFDEIEGLPEIIVLEVGREDLLDVVGIQLFRGQFECRPIVGLGRFQSLSLREGALMLFDEAALSHLPLVPTKLDALFFHFLRGGREVGGRRVEVGFAGLFGLRLLGEALVELHGTPVVVGVSVGRSRGVFKNPEEVAPGIFIILVFKALVV
jgi:hypothetical protein